MEKLVFWSFPIQVIILIVLVVFVALIKAITD